MSLFVHYKNKPYKYVGIARHSETLEELVIYETRYENPSGKVWVRPKEMFLGTVQIGEQTVPRFREVPVKIVEKTDVTDAEVDVLAPLIKATFGTWDSEQFYAKLKSYRGYHLGIGLIDEKPVAFKLGYETEPREFYSWMGGVLPEYRGLGIASSLMTAQHDWCKRHGYTRVQTKTQNKFRQMLILNLKHGFNVIGMHQSSNGENKIILEKRLVRS